MAGLLGGYALYAAKLKRGSHCIRELINMLIDECIEFARRTYHLRVGPRFDSPARHGLRLILQNLVQGSCREPLFLSQSHES